MKEYYPYAIVPFSVEKIRSEGIPAPKLPKLILLPEPARRKYFGTVVFILSFLTFISFTVFTSKFIVVSYGSFLIALISLVATIFEFVQYNNLKKQYNHDYQLYLEHKEIYKKIKSEQEKVLEQNKNDKLVKEYQKEKVHQFFSTSFDVIIAVHNEYSLAKKRFKLFLEEYFPDEILENVKIVHEAKKLEYVPDFIIKFGNPKLNVAIEIEEPYTLSNVPENIQKDYEAKDRIRQRFANELGWIVIVLSEEQSVKSPTESCKFVEESIELLFGDIKTDQRFANIKTIKKQKMLTGEERANLKTTKYREKYLVEAGLLDNIYNASLSETIPEKIESKAVIQNVTENQNGKLQKTLIELDIEVVVNKTTESDILEVPIESLKSKELVEIKNVLINVENNNASIMNQASAEKKVEVENEQLLLIKKIAQKAKIVTDTDNNIKLEQEPIVFKTNDSLEIEVKKDVIVKNPINLVTEVVLNETPENIEAVVENQNTVVLSEEIVIDKVEEEALLVIEEEQASTIAEKSIFEIDEEPVLNIEEAQVSNIDEKSISQIDEMTIQIIEEKTFPVLEEKILSNTELETASVIDENSISTYGLKQNKEQGILNDLYNALDKHSRKQRERKMQLHRISSNGEHVENSKHENKVNELVNAEKVEAKLVEKDGNKVLNNQNVEIENIIIPIEKTEIESISENLIEQSIEIKREEETINLLNVEVETKTEELVSTDKLETLSEHQVDEKQKRKELIEAYREKIEGAVFDKAWNELMDLCNKAIEELPDWDWAYYRRSTAWGNKKDFVNVLEDCNQAIKFNYKLGDAFYNRGTANFFLGKYIEASEDYQRSIDLHYVKKADAHFNRGLCFQKLNQDKAAYIEFVKAQVLGSAKAVDVIRKQYQKDE